MNMRADGARPAKRRRLNIVNDHQIQTAPASPCTQLYPGLAGSHISLPEPEEFHDGRSDPENGACHLASHNSSTSRDCMSGVEEEPSECCYGMVRTKSIDSNHSFTTNCILTQLYGIPINLKCGSGSNSKNIPVDFHRPNCLSSKLDSGSITFDIPCPISARILGELGDVSEIRTQLYCHSKLELSPGAITCQNGRRRGKPSQVWFLNIIIFGRESLGEKVGEYLSRNKMYLQDPVGCERPVPYRNPHIIQPISCETVMTDSFDSALGNLEIERLEAGPDLLAQLMEDDIPLSETEPPDIVKTALFQ
jgi:SWI/SNF-related matrix-associated actin-dependent regulator of chromatin subfamily A3